MEKIKTPQGEMNGVEVDFTISREPWSEYHVNGGEMDGKTIRYRSTVDRMWMIVDNKGKPIIQSDGEPLFYVTSHGRFIVK